MRQYLVRELNRSHSILDYPTCDISLGELRIATQGKGQTHSFSGGPLAVELSPGVTTFLQRPGTRPTSDATQAREQRELFDEGAKRDADRNQQPKKKKKRSRRRKKSE